MEDSKIKTKVPPATGAPPPFGFQSVFGLLKETFVSFSNHHGPKMGAALAYYTAFSLAPLVVFILSIASLVVKKEVARDEIVSQVNNMMGSNASSAVRDIIDHAAAASSTHSATWGTAISFLVLLVGASGAFAELQDSLNQIWEIPPQKHPILNMIRDRALSFSMVFVLGFFMLVSLVLSALIAAFSKIVVTQFPAFGLEITNGIISFIVICGLFATTFRMLPDVVIKWRDVWSGAVFSGFLFVFGKLALGWYIGRNAAFSNYGAAGSFVVILIWVFYSAQILFLGAEFTRAFALRYGSHRSVAK